MSDLPLPSVKMPQSPDQEVRGPFHFLRGGAQAIHLDNLAFDEAITAFIRYAAPPVSNYKAAMVQDADGVVVLGWHILPQTDGVLAFRWIGIRAALDVVRQSPLLDAATVLEIDMAVNT